MKAIFVKKTIISNDSLNPVICNSYKTPRNCRPRYN